MNRNFFRSLLLLAAFNTILMPSSLHNANAQGIITGSISGSVTDASGAIVPNAKVTAKDTAKGTIFDTSSQQDGVFNFRSLPIGSYTLTLTASGFKINEIKNVVVSSGSDRNLGPQSLSIGTSEVVEVEANSTVALDTTASQISATFDTQQLERLPLNNGFDEVALLTPGVVPTHDVSFSNTNGVGFSSNGLRGRSNNFELDGQSNNDNSVAGPQVFFGNQDAIAEIQVIQSNFSAQYGRNTGSVVNYITKSGTNSIHGSGFEIYTGSFLNSYPNQDKSALFGYCPPGVTSSTSNPCSAVSPIPRSVDNRWGGTLGVPILKDKLWAFGSTYWEHTRVGTAPINSGVNLTPTPSGLTQLAALFPNNPAVTVLTNYGPYGVKFGNPTPVLSQASTEKVTAPGGATANIQVAPLLRNAPASAYNDQEQLGRIDWQASPKDRFYVRYFYQKNLSTNNPDNGAGGTFYDVPDVTHSIGADWSRTISSRFVNQLRYSFQQSKLDFQGGSLPGCTVNTLTACPGNVNFASTDLGFGEATNLPQGRTVKVTQVQDNFSISAGKNTILLGFEFDAQNSPNIFLPNYNGTFNPTTGNGLYQSTLDGFLHQTGNYLLATGNPVLPFKENDFAGYFQDDYKLSSSLTLNMGLRYEFFGQAVNTLNDLTTARESNPATALWSTALPLSARTTPRVKSAFKNFEPRVGFAFNPSFAKKTVIRGGYSIGFDPAFYNVFLNFATSAPSAITANIGCNGTCLGSGNFTGAGNRAVNLSKLPLGGNPALADQEFVPSNFHNPYVQTYSFGVEQQITSKVLATVRYVGNHGIGNFQSIDANPLLNPVQYGLPSVAHDFPKYAAVPLCTTTTAVGYGRPNCNLGNLSYIANSAFSIYNSLQTQVTMRGFYGFSGSVNYTFSHTLDNSSEVYSSGAGGSTISVAQNPLDPNTAERGNSATSLPNVLSVGMVYQVPKFNLGNSLIRKVMNGFNLNSIYQYTTGQPYNPYQPNLDLYGLDASYCDAVFNESSVGQGADTCRMGILNKNAPLNTVAIYQGGTYYDLGTFNPVSPANYHWIVNNADYAQLVNNPYPGSGRNILRAQTYNNLDTSIFKDTKLTERINLELQMTAFNVLNRQYRGTPLANAFYDNGATGNFNPFLSNAYNTSNNRNVQLGAKVQF